MSAGARGPVDAWTFVGAVRDKSRRSVTSIIAADSQQIQEAADRGQIPGPASGSACRGVGVKSVMKFVGVGLVFRGTSRHVNQQRRAVTVSWRAERDNTSAAAF